MDLIELKVKILPEEFTKLEKMAEKKGQSVENLLFDFINTKKYTILPNWFTWVMPLVTGFISPFILNFLIRLF